MAFWHRIRNSNLKTSYFQFHRCYTHHLPHSSLSNSIPKTLPIPIPYSHPLFNSVRFFAVPVQFQVKPKKEEDDSDGPRLNDQIKANFVRLVLDDGHSVVSRFEALERARKLKFDLVEVDKNAKPPVCKIMDFHKEMYKKKESDKERAKSKSETTMRKECKEVRFSEKTESKDLKMKADMVRKLMDKGYRVKVKATGNADQAMLDSVSRLSTLIEDVCVVESGPHLTKKEAYMIVRHLKYGPAKKSVKKSQDAVQTDVKAEECGVEPLTATSSDSINHKNQSSPEYQFETQEALISRGNKQFPFSADGSDKSVNDRNDSVSPPVLENRYKKASHHGEHKVQPNAQVPPAVTENRYRKAEPRNRSQQTTPNTNPVTRDTNRWTPSNSNHPSGSRSPMPSRDNIHPNPRGPNTKSPGYGLFSRDT